MYIFTKIENSLLYHIVHVDEVIAVEEDPGDVTDDEDADDDDEYEGKIYLAFNMTLSPLVGISGNRKNYYRFPVSSPP